MPSTRRKDCGITLKEMMMDTHPRRMPLVIATKPVNIKFRPTTRLEERSTQEQHPLLRHQRPQNAHVIRRLVPNRSLSRSWMTDPLTVVTRINIISFANFIVVSMKDIWAAKGRVSTSGIAMGTPAHNTNPTGASLGSSDKQFKITNGVLVNTSALCRSTHQTLWLR